MAACAITRAELNIDQTLHGLWPVGVVFLFLSTGCSSDLDKVCARQQKVVTSEVNALQTISVEQRRAVGALDAAIGSPSDSDAVVCTGTLIRENWVLTARHCAETPLLRFRTADHPLGSDREIAVASAVEARRFTHPTRDVMLLELQPMDKPVDFEIEPLPLAQPIAASYWLGRDALLVGLGDDGSGQRGTRLSAVEPIVDVADEYVTVDGAGRTGACHGDSGGPLLTVAPSGDARVLGVLSWGSDNCRGIDAYERADTLIPWVEEVTRDADANPCGLLTHDGRCDRNVAIWCENNSVRAELCLSATGCGWSDHANGYRCVRVRSRRCGDDIRF